MGQCCSAPRAVDSPRQEAEAGSSPHGLADRVLYPVFQSSSGGLQLAVSQARCAATATGGSHAVLVRQTPQGLFVALFEGLGTDRRSMADFCRSRVLELFQESIVHHPDKPLEALKATLERLDAAIFGTDRLKHSTKVSSGASAVLVLLDAEAQRCYCANVGAAQCLLSRITGSFNAKTPEGFFLTSEHTTRNREELVRLQRRAPGEATPPAGTGSGCPNGDGEQAGEPTRALGFMEAKRQAGGSGALVCEAYATDQALTGADQHLVLGSAAFWQVVGPTDCALRAHFHEKFAQKELDRAAALAATAAAAGLQDAPSPALLQAANTAEHLVYWTLEKATRKLAKLQQQEQQQQAKGQHSGGNAGASGGAGSSGSTGAALPPSVADLLSLPLERLPAPLAPATPDVSLEALEPQTAGEEDEAGAAAAAAAQAEQPPGRLPIRSDVVPGDVGVVVIALRRQNQSMDGGMRDVISELRTRLAARQGGNGACGGGGSGGEGFVERLARRRWSQIRMLVDFYKAHRRVVLRQWWDAQDALYRRSRIAGSSAGRIKLFGGASPGKLAAGAAAVVAAKKAARASSSSGRPSAVGGASPGELAAGAAAVVAAKKAARTNSSSGKSSAVGGVSPGELAAGAAAVVAAKKAARTNSGSGRSSPAASSSIKAVRPGSACK